MAPAPGAGLHEPLLPGTRGLEDGHDAAAPLTNPLLPPPLPPSEAAAAAGPPPAAVITVDPHAPDNQQAREARLARRRELRGLALNALSTVFGTGAAPALLCSLRAWGMSLFAKISGSQGIGVFEIVLTRSLILVAATGPELLHRRVNPFRDRNRGWLLVLRGVLGFCSVSSLYLAVALLPLADASVLSFLSPLFVAALSPVILKEKPNRGTLLGIPVAMVGVVLVAKPSFLFGGGGGGGISGMGVAVGIAQALFNSLSRMSVRALSMNSEEPMASIIFGQGAISCVGAAIMCAATKRFRLPTEPPVWGALLAGGLLGYLYQLALTGGLQRARAAPAVAMTYLGVVWGILGDVFVFHDLPGPLSLAGAGIICCSSFFVAFSMKKGSTKKAAGERFAKSTARLAAEGGEGAAAPLLGRRGGASASEASLLESAEWASAREGSASRASSAWWEDAASDAGDGGGGGGLKAEVKEAAARVAAAAAEEVAPDTPAAPAELGAAPLHNSSAGSLALLGDSPGGGSLAGDSPGSRPGSPRPGDAV